MQGLREYEDRTMYRSDNAKLNFWNSFIKSSYKHMLMLRSTQFEDNKVKIKWNMFFES